MDRNCSEPSQVTLVSYPHVKTHEVPCFYDVMLEDGSLCVLIVYKNIYYIKMGFNKWQTDHHHALFKYGFPL